MGPRSQLVFCIDYRYDLCGNRVLRMRQPAEGGRESATTYYDYNELNQLTRAVDVERDDEFQTYLIGATYYDWDAEGQLTGVRSLAGLSNAFAYDGRYQRVEKQQAAGTVRYNWDGLNVLLERDGEDEPLATHTHGPVPIAGIGTHLTTRKHGETPEDQWVHHDAIGSTGWGQPARRQPRRGERHREARMGRGADRERRGAGDRSRSAPGARWA